jgi:hypothetical protein
MLNLIYNESSETVNDHFSKAFRMRLVQVRLKIVGGSIIGASFFQLVKEKYIFYLYVRCSNHRRTKYFL